MYSLYSTVVRASFGHILEEEVQGIISVMGALIFAKQPLHDDMLITFPAVKVKKSNVLGLIRKGLMSVIESGPILHFHHRSFEDFLLSPSFQRTLPNLSGVQDRELHEYHFSAFCLDTMVSTALHFNNVQFGIFKHKEILDTVKSAIPPLVSYSSLFWASHLVHTQYNRTLMKAVEFVMYENGLK